MILAKPTQTVMQYTTATSADVAFVKDVLNPFVVKVRKVGTGIFIGKQTETISYDKFVAIFNTLKKHGYGNNDSDVLISNAEQGILNGFQVFKGK